MDEKRRAEIRAVVEHFKAVPVNQDVLTEYCNVNKVEQIVLGDFTDYRVQVEHDEIIQKIFPLILQEVSKLQYAHEFDSIEERKRIKDANDELRVNIVKIFEEHALEIRYLSTTVKELAEMAGGLIALAAQTAENKSASVAAHLLRKQFGAEFNMKHAADYAEAVYGAKEKE